MLNQFSRTDVEDMAISCRSPCICPPGTAKKCTQRRQIPGSNAFVPNVAGLLIAGEVVKDLSGTEEAGDVSRCFGSFLPKCVRGTGLTSAQRHDNIIPS